MSTWQTRLFIRHLRNEKGTGAEMCPAIVCGIVAGWGRGGSPRRADQLLAEVFAKANAAQFPSRF